MENNRQIYYQKNRVKILEKKKVYYQKNKVQKRLWQLAYVDKNRYAVNTRVRKQRHKNKLFLKQIKLEMECEHCKYNENAVAMDFHHLNRKEKSFSISRSAHYDLLTLLREIDKCIILCANCHRLRHHNDLDL